MRPLLALAAVLSSFALFGCNTIAGAGEDVSDAGSAVTEAALKTEANM